MKISKIKENEYLLNLEIYRKKKLKNFKNFVPFCFLDIDPKTQIKNFHSYSYDTKYYDDDNEKEIKIKKNKKEKHVSKNEEYINYVVDKPKMNLKFSFDLDDNEINLINEFVVPDPKYLRNGEYLQTDDFSNLVIDKSSFHKIFEYEINENKNIFESYCNKDSNEFVEDYMIKFNITTAKKKNLKFKESKDKDYLIYDVNENQFYKKVTNDQNSKHDLLTSPKVKVPFKKLPISIYENHYA